MPQTPDSELREAIYSRIAELDGCYLLVYSGLGEKLAFLSVFLKEPKTKLAGKLLIDLGLQKYIDKFRVKGTTLVGNLSEAAKKSSLESFFLEFIRGEIEKLIGGLGGDSHAIIAIDLSSFLKEARNRTKQDVYLLHKSIVNLIHSLRGVTGILLYDVESLNENLISKLIELHGVSDCALKRFGDPKAIKEEPKLKIDAGCLSPAIVALNGGIMFFDPPSRSAAALIPNTDAIKQVLPNDPLDFAHRHFAFENNYTAHEGACPYFSAQVPSGCLLDPNVMSAMRLRGRSFIEGHPCITATDHSILEKKPSNKQDDERKDDCNCHDTIGANGFTMRINKIVNREDHLPTSKP